MRSQHQLLNLIVPNQPVHLLPLFRLLPPIYLWFLLPNAQMSIHGSFKPLGMALSEWLQGIYQTFQLIEVLQLRLDI